jgi:hypothetical protein
MANLIGDGEIKEMRLGYGFPSWWETYKELIFNFCELTGNNKEIK